jgi:hypothetical protein
MSTHGLSATRVGQDALGDRHFVKQARGEYRSRPKRRVWPETEAKVPHVHGHLPAPSRKRPA